MFLARRPAAFLIAALLSPLAAGAARDEPDWGEPAETVTLTGVVRTAGGNPAPGVAVTARGVSNVAGVEPRYGEPQTVTADEDGAFTFEAVPAAEGYQLTTPETPAGVGHGLVRTGEAGEPAAVTVRPAGPLRLAVTNPDGSPAAGTRAVLLTGVAGGRQYGLLLPPDAPPAGDDGVLTIPGVWRGAEVTALLRAPGGRRQSAGPFVVPDDAEPGDDADPEPVTLAPGGTLIVRAEPTPGGAPLPAAGYSLIVADDSRDLLTQIRDDAATFAVGDDGAATLTLAVPADGGSPFAPALEVGADAAEPAEAEVEAALGWPSVVNVLLSHPDVTLTPTARTVEVAAGETVTAVFNAIETATITGRIVDERGEPLAPSEASYPSVIPFVKVAENAEGAGAFPDVGAGPGWEMAVLPRDLPPVDEDGRFAIPAPPGAVKVTVADAAGGRFGAVRELTLTADGADLGDVALPPLPTLTGTVDERGRAAGRRGAGPQRRGVRRALPGGRDGRRRPVRGPAGERPARGGARRRRERRTGTAANRSRCRCGRSTPAPPGRGRRTWNSRRAGRWKGRWNRSRSRCRPKRFRPRRSRPRSGGTGPSRARPSSAPRGRNWPSPTPSPPPARRRPNR